MQKIASKVEPIKYSKETLSILDQRLLPYKKIYNDYTSYQEVIQAIKDMVLRGAPLIGITAAYAMILAANKNKTTYNEAKRFIEKLNAIGAEIKEARPTAINLVWAIDLILNDINALENINEITDSIEKRALWIHNDDKERCLKMGVHGAILIKKGAGILTICNTGALATGGIGTAFGVIQTAHSNDSSIKIYAAETRPRQQGARLTTFEFKENNINCTLLPDTACGHIMKEGLIDIVITGADRIASNGDSANKIGTYQLAVLAKENNIPFYIAAPLSTFDLSIKLGSDIPIEQRNEKEVMEINGQLICPEGIKALNPAFDVTPAKYINGIITEKGILKPNFNESIDSVFNESAIV